MLDEWPYTLTVLEIGNFVFMNPKLTWNEVKISRNDFGCVMLLVDLLDLNRFHINDFLAVMDFKASYGSYETVYRIYSSNFSYN